MGDNNQGGAANAPAVDLNQVRKNKREKLANLQAAGKDPFVITKYDQTYHSADAKAEYEELEAKLLAGRTPVNTDGMDEADARAAVTADYNEKRAIMDASPINVSIAGRIMLKRVMGKASFFNTVETVRAGFTRGRVIKRSFCQNPAPSTVAAS